MRGNLPQREPATLEHWQQLDIHQRLRKERAGQPRYVLHDGPPYANGAIHLGHAVNKILKDIAVKSRTLAGFDAPYVPGWDCHGLPIALQVFPAHLGGDSLLLQQVPDHVGVEPVRGLVDRFHARSPRGQGVATGAGGCAGTSAGIGGSSSGGSMVAWRQRPKR